MGEKLKIGIMVENIQFLRNYELKIIHEIIQHPELDLRLFIQDGRNSIISEKRNKDRNEISFNSKSFSGRLLARQLRAEARLFKLYRSINPEEVLKQVDKIESITVIPVREGSTDIFSNEDVERIRRYDLDLILRYHFGGEDANVSKAAIYGVWNLYCGEEPMVSGCPAGFMEIIKKESCCEVTLRMINSESGKCSIIDHAYYNRQWSLYRNSYALYQASVTLVMKNILKLLTVRKIEIVKVTYSGIEDTGQYGLRGTLIYLIKFYQSIFMSRMKSILLRFFKIRYGCWSLYLGKGNFLTKQIQNGVPLNLAKGEFWADPFLYKKGEDLYVFFESYSYKEEKGRLSVGRIEGNRVMDVKNVLDLKYHLSYPHLIEEGGELYMIPEEAYNNKLEVYKCIDFPYSWELYNTQFDGENITDATYFQDRHNERWLFLTKGYLNDAALYIYKIDSLKFRKVQAHELNPVYIDCRKARGGGGIFTYNGEFFRPSQMNVDGIYGRGLVISKIKKLTLQEYIEEHILTIGPKTKHGIMGIHHLHQIDGSFIFDCRHTWK